MDEESTEAPETAPDAETIEAESEPTIEATVEEFTLGDVSSLDDEALIARHAEIDAEVVAIRSADPASLGFADVARARAMREAQAEITALLEARAAEREQVAEELAAIGDAPALPQARAASTATEPPPATVAAQAIRDREAPVSDPAPAARTASPVQWMSQMDEGSADWGRLVNATRPTRANGGQIDARPREAVLASVRVERDTDMELTDSASANDRIIAQAMEAHRAARETTPGARLAAVCDPATILRDAMVCGTDATPFQSSLVQLTASSGNALRYQYRTATSIASADDGVTAWTATEQGSVLPTDASTWKPCATIACPDYTTVTASEFTACYEIDAFTELSSPEAVGDFAMAKDRAFARYTEGWFLRQASSLSYHLSHGSYTGAVPDIIDSVLSALAAGTYGERLDLTSGYVVYGSPGVIAAATIDENRKAYRSGGSALEDVAGIIGAATGTDYVQLLDLPLTSGGAVPATPFQPLGTIGAASATVQAQLSQVSFSIWVLDPSAFVAFTTGEAIFGDQITLDQARRNQRGFFQRAFGGLMKPGCAPGFRIDIRLCTDGGRGGFVVPECGLGS